MSTAQFLMAAILVGGCRSGASVDPRPRPASEVTVESEAGYPFLVHGPAGIEEFLRDVRDAADEAWYEEIVVREWPPPLPDRGGRDDRLDIYVESDIEAYVLDEDAITEGTATCFVGVPDAFDSSEELASVVAHELNHTSQFAMRSDEDDAFYEHTATFVERSVVDHFLTYGAGIEDFQGHPERPLDYIEDDLFEYGAMMWLMFLDEHLGESDGRLIQRLWEGAGSFLDSLDAILNEHGMTRGEFFATFGVWRYFTGDRDDGNHFSVGGDWGDESLIRAEELEDKGWPIHMEQSLAAFGTKIALVTVGESHRHVSLSLTGEHAAIALLAIDDDGESIGEATTSLSNLEATLPETTSHVVVAMTYAPLRYDPADDDWDAREIAATLIFTP